MVIAMAIVTQTPEPLVLQLTYDGDTTVGLSCSQPDADPLLLLRLLASASLTILQSASAAAGPPKPKIVLARPTS